jgi:predicted secreted protein
MKYVTTGIGTTFSRWNDSSWESFTDIVSITGPELSKDIIDVTSLSSSGGYREFINGLRNGGTVVLKMNYTRRGYSLMKVDYDSNTAKNYAIVLPDVDETMIAFEGIVQDLPLTIPADDKISMDITIKVTGEVTISDSDSSGIVETIFDETFDLTFN